MANIWQMRRICDGNHQVQPLILFFLPNNITSNRIDIFGFSGVPGTTQNAGLLDQRMAVKWTRDNIAAVGGGPERIIFFGQSAGGISIDCYSYVYRDNPIALMEIGQAITLALNAANATTAAWDKVSSTHGCATMLCMKGKSYE